ncbi:MAG TPA: hypothetical protein VNI83_07535 [Vicinamibacterales bacterium]|nr:hypothetical protein [Vicinamibacterales bacterium]
MIAAVAVACAAAGHATPAAAQSQALNFSLGYFTVKGEDARVDDDVLLADLGSSIPLLFEINDFNGASVGVEWLAGLNDWLEAGVGAGFYRRTVPSVYATLTRPGGAEIEQDLRLRVAPFTATIRVLPFGRAAVQPYIGGGVGVLSWRYSETGEFVDSFTFEIFRARYTQSGVAIGPVVLGGLRAALDDWLVGAELRYQGGEGELPVGGTDGFLGSRIDLGGYTFSVTFGRRF